MTTTNIAATPTPDLSMLPNMEGKVKAVLNLDFSRGFEDQVKAYLEGLGNGVLELRSIALVGQGVAATLALAAFEMACGLPILVFKGFGVDAPFVEVDLSAFRHNEVRDRRSELAHGDAFLGFTVLDGSGRGLTPLQLAELAAQLGVEEGAIRVLNIQAGVKGQVDLTSPEGATAGMADLLVGLGLTKEDWTSGRVVFLPGGAGIVGVLQATAIHGISEAWPRTIRLAQRAVDADKAFHVAEVVDPQAMRQWAVGLVRRLNQDKPFAVLQGLIPEEFRAALLELAAEHGVTVLG